MYPNSTKSGAAVSNFPDVCKTPIPGGPVPLPDPTVGLVQTTSRPAFVAAGIGVAGPNIKQSGVTRTIGNQSGATAASPMKTPSVKTAASVSVMNVNLSVSGASITHSLRNKLNQLNTQLLSLPGSDPNRWHTLVDEYVQTTAHLYKALASSKPTVHSG